MAFLSDHTLRACLSSGRIKVSPLDLDNVQPASIDLTLDKFFRFPLFHTEPEDPASTNLTFVQDGPRIDPRVALKYGDFTCADDQPYHLPAYGFVLGSTVERITLPDDIIGRLEGKSSLGRLGLTAHITAGFFDPGFDGHATLELFNANPVPFLLYPGMPICQMSFARLTTRAEHPYGHDALRSKYQHQERGPKGSLFHQNFED